MWHDMKEMMTFSTHCKITPSHWNNLTLSQMIWPVQLIFLGFVIVSLSEIMVLSFKRRHRKFLHSMVWWTVTSPWISTFPATTVIEMQCDCLASISILPVPDFLTSIFRNLLICSQWSYFPMFNLILITAHWILAYNCHVSVSTNLQWHIFHEDQFRSTIWKDLLGKWGVQNIHSEL